MQDRVDVIEISHNVTTGTRLGESASGGDSSTVKHREESFYFACPHDVFKDTFTCRRDHPFHVIPSRVCVESSMPDAWPCIAPSFLSHLILSLTRSQPLLPQPFHHLLFARHSRTSILPSSLRSFSFSFSPGLFRLIILVSFFIYPSTFPFFSLSFLLCWEETRNRPWDWEQDFLTTSYTFLHLPEEECLT